MMKPQQGVIRRMLLGVLIMSFAYVAPTSVFGSALEQAASFYKNKTIAFVVTVAPGGGYDTYARMVAPYLAKETGAAVVVQNMVGGEGVIARRYVYNAKPDGLTLLISGDMKVILWQLFGDPKVKGMDVRKINWLAGLENNPSVLLLTNKFPYRTIGDLRAAKHAITSAVMSESSPHLAIVIFGEALGINVKVLTGLSGSAEWALAAMRGETTVLVTSAKSALENAKQPEFIPFVTLNLSRAKLFPNLPSINELETIPHQHEKWFKWLEKLQGLDRVISTTPGVSQERIQFLRNALKKVCYDKQFLGLAERRDLPIEHIPGEESQSTMNELLSMSEGEVKELKNMLEKSIIKTVR